MVGRHRQFWTIVCILLAAGISSQADDIPGDLSGPFLVRSWQTEQGLPHNMVLAITQTRDGYIWLGTAQGLARFDGVNCKMFGLQDGLNGLEISSLLEDSGGALWIGTVGGGLNRYFHGKMEKVKAGNGLNGEAITALLEDKEGAIWIGTTADLYRLQNGQFAPLAGLTNAIFVRALAKDREGAVWVSTLHNGLMRFLEGKSVAAPETPEMRSVSACYLLADNEDRLWAGLWGGPQMGDCPVPRKWEVEQIRPGKWLAGRLYQQPGANAGRHNLGRNARPGVVLFQGREIQRPAHEGWIVR